KSSAKLAFTAPSSRPPTVITYPTTSTSGASISPNVKKGIAINPTRPYRGLKSIPLYCHIAATRPRCHRSRWRDRIRPASGNSGVGHASILHGARVRDADRAAHGGDLAAEQERPRQAQQRVGLDQRVRVHGDDQREPAGVDGGVERVRLAAVLLVEDEQARA